METTYPNGYYRATPYFAATAVLGALMCAWAWSEHSFATTSISMFVSFVGAIGLLVCALTGWGLERNLAFFRQGDALARWEVDGQQWQDFARAQRAKLAESARWVVLGLVVSLCVIAAIGYDDPELVLLVGSMFVVLTVLVLVLVRFAAGRPYAPGVTSAVIEVGPSLVLINGHPRSFAGFGQQLTGIEIDDHKQLLTIRSLNHSGESTVPFEQELPYPAEAKEQALRALILLSAAYGLSPAEPEA